MQRAIAAAQNSRMGNGGSAHRIAGVSRFVDHGHHAAFDVSFFRQIGGYDENFWFNEDAEFDHRSHLNSGRIWLSAEAAIIYYPRPTLPSLARQYYNFGTGRAKTILTHRALPKLRHLLPIVLLAFLFGSFCLSPFVPLLLIGPLALVAIYGAFSVVMAVNGRDAALLWAGPAAFVMHISWAVGFLAGWQANWRTKATSPYRPLDASSK
jgi:succinoglycan biosynthesis protein ExoA